MRLRQRMLPFRLRFERRGRGARRGGAFSIRTFESGLVAEKFFHRRLIRYDIYRLRVERL